MCEAYTSVPWFNSAEWHDVYEKIFSASASLLNKEDALNTLTLWKSRCPSLPSGIESTLSLLQVQLSDVKTCKDLSSQYVLRLAYSSAIIRFVNHMLDSETSKGASLYAAAKTKEVPEWIVDLRHDTAHHNKLPSLEMLQEAASIGMIWLQTNYWDKHKDFIADYTVQKRVRGTVYGNSTEITNFINYCLSLSMCTHRQRPIKYISQIPDEDMQKSLIEDVQELCSDLIDTKNYEIIALKSLVNMLNGQCKRILKGKDVAMQVNKSLLGESSVILSIEALQEIEDEDVIEIKKLPAHYVLSFELLLGILHTHNLILDFILELISITQNETYNNGRRRLAALWVTEILNALKRSHLFLDKKHRINQDRQMKSSMERTQLFYHWFPQDKRNTLLLDLNKDVPKQLTDINFIQPILCTYNPYLNIFVRELVQFLDQKLPDDTADKIFTLSELVSNPEKFVSSIDQIHSLDDVYDSKNCQDSDSDCVEIVEENHIIEEIEIPSGIWKLAPHDYNWALCPIGILPWQLSNDDSMDIAD